MTRRSYVAVLMASAFCITSSAFALYSVSNTGDWPKSWPAALEPLRRTSRTLVGPMVEQRHYAIPFKDREEFEAGWPHIVSVKSPGAPIFLIKAPNFFLDKAAAGVVVHAPPSGQPEHPKDAPNRADTNLRSRWMSGTFIDLVVDGSIVDMNRIPLPADTPIVDMRFGPDAKNVR